MTESQALARLTKGRVDEAITPEDTDDTEKVARDVAIDTSETFDQAGHRTEDEIRFGYEEMMLDNQRYLCKLPIIDVAAGRPDANQTLSKQEEEKELIRANNRGWELLQGMQGNCVYFWSGWWSYRYCYGQGVKQFHQLAPSQGTPAYPPVEDPSVLGFTLGSVEESLHKGEKGLAESKKGGASQQTLGVLETKGESRYLVQRLGGGTLCDLTGKERRIEIQVSYLRNTTEVTSQLTLLTSSTATQLVRTRSPPSRKWQHAPIS